MKNIEDDLAERRVVNLPDPKRVGVEKIRLDEPMVEAMKIIASHKCIDLSDFEELLGDVKNALTRVAKSNLFFDHDRFDTYDEYFEVGRRSGTPAQLLAEATVISLFDLAVNARGGHDLDPFAVSTFLLAIKTHARTILGDNYA